jgi:AcrR family transcriptional regulator
MATRTVDVDHHDTKARLLDTAVELFAENSIAGTSLQMIADRLGVTKAAVYHHFKTKDEIVVEVSRPAIAELIDVLDAGEAVRGRGRQLDLVLDGFVGVVVRHRRLLAMFGSDPLMARALLDCDEQFAQIEQRLTPLLAGGEPDLASTLAAHVALAGIAQVAGSPLYTHLSDGELHAHLVEAGRRLLGRRRRLGC